MADGISENSETRSIEHTQNDRWGFLKRFQKTAKESPSSSLELRKARGDLIDKILKEGLLSSATLKEQQKDFLSSIDNDTLPLVFGRTFELPQSCHGQDGFDRYVKHALYNGGDCIIPVLAERPGEHWNTNILFKSNRAEREQISKKVFSSFMVVYKTGPTDIRDAIGRDESLTSADKIAYLIFPEQILKEYDSTVLKEKNIPVKIVARKIQRSLSAGDPVDVPDYETAIKEIVKELDSPIWVSGVRLPTSEDLAKRSAIE